MGVLNNYINKDLIFLNLEAEDKKLLLQYMAKKLEKNGNVSNTYIEEVVKREEIFPTGLQVDNLGVALPHSDFEHVNSPAVSLAVLKEPIDFYSMEDHQKKISVSVVFMLAVNDGNDQLKLLQEIISLIQSKEGMNSVIEASTKEEVFKIFSS